MTWKMNKCGFLFHLKQQGNVLSVHVCKRHPHTLLGYIDAHGTIASKHVPYNVVSVLWADEAVNNFIEEQTKA